MKHKLIELVELAVGLAAFYVLWFVWRADDLMHPGTRQKIGMIAITTAFLIGSFRILLGGT